MKLFHWQQTPQISAMPQSTGVKWTVALCFPLPVTLGDFETQRGYCVLVWTAEKLSFANTACWILENISETFFFFKQFSFCRVRYYFLSIFVRLTVADPKSSQFFFQIFGLKSWIKKKKSFVLSHIFFGIVKNDFPLPQLSLVYLTSQ